MRTKKPIRSPYKRRFYKPSRWSIKVYVRDKHAHVVIGSRRKGRKYDEHMSLQLTSSPKHGRTSNLKLPKGVRSGVKESKVSYLRKDINYGLKSNYVPATVGEWKLGKDIKKAIAELVENKKTGGRGKH